MSIIIDIKSFIRANGPATCRDIAAAVNAEPRDIIPILRNAVDRMALSERNGFYDLLSTESRRQSFNWIEGCALPGWVYRLARGPRTCESIDVVAELNTAKQEQGWPRFIFASIDVRLSCFKCLSTGELVDRYVLRYMPLDTREARL
ncbi:hypothetical protein QNH14_02370 [Apirhabdus apintestini]|nr:hypothetical protein QNH14_02370 [Enterobacteriaceae bacterium CA-0114]